MNLPEPTTAGALARQLNARLIGDASLEIRGLNEIHKVRPGDAMFVDNDKYFAPALRSAASVILIHQPTECPPDKALLVLDDPFRAYNDLVKKYRPVRVLDGPLGRGSVVHPSTTVEPGVVIGNYVRIGRNCRIQANVVIRDHVVIGDHVLIQSGTVIGNDAFYFKRHPDGTFEEWRSGGRVVIEDRVNIGAGCTIAKGVSGDTVIGAGSKLDCQVHLGHGAVVGKNCLLAGQVGIGGKTVLGDRVVLYGQVGIAQNLTIGDEAVVLAKSGISKSLSGGKTYFGYPAGEVKTKYRELAGLRHLPKLIADFYR